jgi:predicted transcriptional regulator of viral defense system
LGAEYYIHLDSTARPDLCGGLEELVKGIWMRKGNLNENRLVAYAERLDHRAAARRTGFLLETLGLGRPETIARLQALVNPRYALLDPTLPDEGSYRARWRLRVNLDPEELRATLWT